MNKSVLCIGATLVDELYFCEQNCIPHTSNPAAKTTSIGGVISNIAQHLGVLQLHPSLITALGTDTDAEYIAKNLFDRSYYYNQAQFKVVIDGQSAKEITNEIELLLA